MKKKSIFKRIFYRLKSIPYLNSLKRGITKKDFTIVCNDCCGGVIYHRIGKKFFSPFINLFITHDDFITLLSDFDYYMNEQLIEDHSESSYPIGLLGSVKIHFLHYNNFQEAKESWERRKKRIVYDRFLILLNLTNTLDIDYVNKYIDKLEKLNFKDYIILSRFESSNSNVIKIDFSDLKEFKNAQVLAPEKYPFRLHIDQMNYRECFKRFDI